MKGLEPACLPPVLAVVFAHVLAPAGQGRELLRMVQLQPFMMADGTGTRTPTYRIFVPGVLASTLSLLVRAVALHAKHARGLLLHAVDSAKGMIPQCR